MENPEATGKSKIEGKKTASTKKSKTHLQWKGIEPWATLKWKDVMAAMLIIFHFQNSVDGGKREDL